MPTAAARKAEPASPRLPPTRGALIVKHYYYQLLILNLFAGGGNGDGLDVF
jgi:hypothetical protein